MATTTKTQKTTGRNDHYLPQGYLRGFIDPARSGEPRPLWHFDISTKRWSQKSTREVGCEIGFYDYAGKSPELIPADKSFERLEREFPQVRDCLIAAGFKGWQDHLPFLLDFANMIRARSPLFLSQLEDLNHRAGSATIAGVDHATNSTIVDSVETKPATETWVRNRGLVEMREEIDKGANAEWSKGVHWCLRTTDSPEDPVVVSGEVLAVAQPITKYGQRVSLNQDTIFYFPLCWSACLVGAYFKFQADLDRFAPSWLKFVRQMYRANAQSYLVSPHRIPDL